MMPLPAADEVFKCCVSRVCMDILWRFLWTVTCTTIVTFSLNVSTNFTPILKNKGFRSMILSYPTQKEPVCVCTVHGFVSAYVKQHSVQRGIHSLL